MLTCGHPQQHLGFKTSPRYCGQQLWVQELLLLLIPLPGSLDSRGKEAGWGRGRPPGSRPKGPEQEGDFSMAPWVNFLWSEHPALVSQSAGAFSSAPAVPLRLGRGLQGLYFQL